MKRRKPDTLFSRYMPGIPPAKLQQGAQHDLPFFKDHSKLTGKLLGGWQISGVTQFQTGTPCGVTEAKDYAGVGLDSNFGCGTNGQYYVVNGTPKIIGTFGATGQWFDTSVFAKPTAGTFNTQRVRDLIYQPGFQNWNLGLFKAIPINERFRFQFRAEAFNFINHPNWGGGSGGGVSFTDSRLPDKWSNGTALVR